MKSERIGNDIKIEWGILRQGVPFSLTGKDVTIYLGSPFGRTKISGFSIDSNKVLWTFFGKDQKSLGKYSLILVVNEGNEGMITTDICDFVNLVDCSCKVGGADDAGVQTETISLTSNLEYVASGAYDDTAVWEYIDKLEKNKADKTEIPTKVSQLENDADYATKNEIDSKQDEIKDLDAIRSGAAKGATALQSIPAEYVTDDELDNALKNKVNVNQIATINGKSLVNGGNIVITGGEGGGYDDTEIRAELDELSAEIEQVSENKQDKISDLDSIRSGASKGKTSEQTSNKTTTISESSTDTQYPSAKAVYDATQKMMPATPSGDPMHYMYEAEGATYNATDADISMVGMYGDSYVHKAKHWHLNELGDLTNEEMKNIYLEMYPIASLSVYAEWFGNNKKSRTNLSKCLSDAGAKSYSYTFYSTSFKTLKLGISENALISSMSYTFAYSSTLEKILTILNVSYTSGAVSTPFQHCSALKYVRLKGLKVSMPMNSSKNLSNDSILYMIVNEAASSAITITLHADAYDRAMADADIQAALTAHPNVSLAK